ncbi:MAG: hypothetical protein ACHQY2_02350 [Candidatus Eremiobacterales bacterium]|jgi:hypothetical protein
MGLDRQISFASKTLFFIAAVSVIHIWTSGLMLVTWSLGSGFVDLGSAYVIGGQPILGYALEVTGSSGFIILGLGVSCRNAIVTAVALLFLIVDCLVLFYKLAPIGAPAASIGILASFLVVFHAIVWWCVFRAFWAARQYRVNSAVVRRLGFETELRRRLADSDEVPPPAATFDTRFRGITPSGPASPPQPQG